MRPSLNVGRVFAASLFVLLAVGLAFVGAINPGQAIAAVIVGGLVVEALQPARNVGLVLGALTPSFLFDFESEMQVITDVEYARATLSENKWWHEVSRVRNTNKRREIVAWLLSTAQIYDQGKQGGNTKFDDLVSKYTTFEVRFAGNSLKLQRSQLEDNDGDGFDFAADWSAQVGAQMVYWPQKQIANMILAGETLTGPGGAAYDGKAFFAVDHPVNPFDSAAGTYANLLTSASGAGGYPGACPIDSSVTIDVAIANLQKVISYIQGLKMPNGKDPRFLSVAGIMGAPALQARLQLLTNAKILPLGATGGAGSADVEGVIRNWGFGKPINVQEFGNTGTAADDTSFYVIAKQAQSTPLGGIVYVEREPFHVTYYTGQGGGTGVDAILDRANELEWHNKGRNVAAWGHPYALFKVKAA